MIGILLIIAVICIIALGVARRFKEINENTPDENEIPDDGRELGYYWVEFMEKDNWLIFWFNGGYWQSLGEIIKLDDPDILSVDPKRLQHK